MNTNPLISVVMLNYNGLQYLRRTIPPILNLSYPNYEFIIVDNGSTDGSIAFINGFNNIKLIENGVNLGYSKGKNIGVKKAQGKYILLLDNDIIIKEINLLDKLLNRSFRGPKSILTLAFKDSISKHVNYVGGFFSSYFLCKDHNDKISPVIDNSLAGYPNGGIFYFLKEAYLKIGGFDESQKFHVDDKDFGIRAYLLGYSIYLFSESYQEHIGYFHRDDLNSWCWKYKYYFSGYLRTIVKNLKLRNLVFISLNFIIYSFLKTTKQVFLKKSLLPLKSYLHSVYLFVKNLPDTLRQRRIIQSKRVINEDVFLKIKPPKFD
jgi:GT2 family glycosyltransferase